jgi:phosphate transport system protein
MFRQLFEALTSGDLLDQAFHEFGQMLDHAEWMFIRANEALRRQVNPEEVRESIYRRDKNINDLERSIRRKIVQHLTINPGGDIAACLALMSIVKDAERIGDYCKNVFEVARFYTEEFHVPKYNQPLESIRVDTLALFGSVKRAFSKSDPAGAKAALKAADDIGDRCDDVIEALLNDKSDMHTHEAVAYSLLARHYKRVSSHLSNIATAVLGKIADLDFRP